MLSMPKLEQLPKATNYLRFEAINHGGVYVFITTPLKDYGY